MGDVRMFGGSLHTDVFYTILCVCYVLGALSIAYLLARHTLLANGRLQPDAFGCGDFTHALLTAIKSLNCGCRMQPATPRLRAMTSVVDDSDEDSIHLKVVVYGTFATLIFYMFFCLNTALLCTSMLGWLPFRWCKMALPISFTLLVLAKCNMYAVFVSRLHFAFDNTIYEYNEWLIRALYASTAAVGTFCIGVASVLNRGKYQTDDVHKSDAPFCENQMPHFVIVLFTAYEFFFTLFVLWLFVSALKRVIRSNTEHMDDRSRDRDRKLNSDIYLLPMKYTVLSSVAVASTMLNLIIYVSTDAPFLFALDSVVNCTALILMTGKWAPVYTRCCTPVLRCLVRAPCLPCFDPTEAELIELVAERTVVLTRAQSTSDGQGTV